MFATSGLLGCFVQRPLAGGYSAIAVNNKEVIDAAVFAVKIQQKVMQHQQGEPPAKLELAAIIWAEQQVVAGMNYRIRLKVKVDGVEKVAEAVVWWQPWEKPESYQLTSWKWSWPPIRMG
ncbi:MAG TPA: cystatin domain-containing protein [Geobacteraceae bacterium]